jgi:hypothetical protein
MLFSIAVLVTPANFVAPILPGGISIEWMLVCAFKFIAGNGGNGRATVFPRKQGDWSLKTK